MSHPIRHMLFAILILALLLGLALTLTLTPARAAPSSGNFTFYAIYDQLADNNSIGANITNSAMSGDGEKLIFSGWIDATSTPVLYTVDADGSDLTQIPLPDLDGRFVKELTIDRDGSRAFFRAVKIPFGATDWVFKVEGGTATKIFQTTDYAEIASAAIIQTTAGGEYVYFLDDGINDNDVWRVGQAGGAPAKIIEDTDVIHNGYPGALVSGFAISADAGTIAFTLYGYWDSGFRGRKELFVKDGGGYTKLTSVATSEHSGATLEAISGDGTTIAYAANYKRYAIGSDGNNQIELETTGWNFGGLGLIYDGSQMFYYDDGANGGRLTNTDGSGRLDLFPRWNVGAISIAATKDADISNDGRRVTFRCGDALYIGFLNDPAAAPDAPAIHDITFDPAAMPRGDSSARVTITSQISDLQGLPDIERTSTDEMLNGLLASDWYKLPVSIDNNAHDDGAAPDETADDGIFSTSGAPAGAIATVDQMSVRMAAQDASKTVVVADAILLIGQAGQMPLLPPSNVQAQSGVESIELTWNPSTSPDLAGYNVYRSTVYTPTSDSNCWAQINPTLVTGDRYLDSSSLTAGNTYYYYLTAADAVSESIPSNIAFAVFGQLKFFIPDSYGANGDNVTLPVNIANANGLEMCAVDIYVTYDQTALTATDVEQTALTAGYGWAKNISTPGVVRAVIAAVNGDILYGEGTLFNVLFDVIGSANDTSDLEFQVAGTTFYDCDDLVTPVPLDLSDVGVFTVQAGFILGDLNGDGNVTNADADLALEIAVGNLIPTPEQEAAGDLNGDGRINAADAALIMRLAAGLPLFPTIAQLSDLSLNRVDAVSLSAPTDATFPEGGSAWVAFSISDASNLASADITLNYDPFIATVTGARATTLSENFDVEFNITVAGQAHISLKPKPGHEDGLTSGSGVLVEVEFTASSSAAVGSTSPMNLAAVRLSDRYGRDFATSALQVDVSATPGLLTVEAGGYAIYLPLVVR